MRHHSAASRTGHLAAMLMPDTSSQLAAAQLDAVIIRDLTYEAGRSRRRKTILNRINLTVPEGSM